MLDGIEEVAFPRRVLPSFASRFLYSDFVYVGTFSTLLSMGEEDNLGFMALSEETMRRPSSWHPIWILKVLHMAFICAGMCFRIGSKTTTVISKSTF